MPTPSQVRAIHRAARTLSAQLQPLLTKHHPVTQGAALVDLVATWLAAHVEEGGLSPTRALRQQLLSDFIIAVEAMVPVCAEELGTPHDPIAYRGEVSFRRQ